MCNISYGLLTKSYLSANYWTTLQFSNGVHTWLL